jgi:hypothetical protein
MVSSRWSKVYDGACKAAREGTARVGESKHPELHAAAEEAKPVLKNRLEVDDSKHRFHSELGVFKDDLRIIKD